MSGKGTYLAVLALVFAPRILLSGDYAAEFLRIGVGARALGMGAAFVAVANDGTAAFWNPAGLTGTASAEIYFTHAPMFGGVAHHNFASASLRLSDNTHLAVSGVRLEVGDIPRYSELAGTRFDRIRDPTLRSNGDAEGFFGDTEQAVLLSISRSVDFDIRVGGGLAPVLLASRLSFGLNLKYIHQTLDTSVGSGQGLDFGLLWELRGRNSAETGRAVLLGLMLRDVLDTTISWNTVTRQRDHVRRHASFGVAYTEWFPRLHGRLTFSLHRDDDTQAWANWGGEYGLADVIFVRAGSRQGHLTAGAGIRVFEFQIDYAFVGYDLGATHRISGSVRF